MRSLRLPRVVLVVCVCVPGADGVLCCRLLGGWSSYVVRCSAPLVLVRVVLGGRLWVLIAFVAVVGPCRVRLVLFEAVRHLNLFVVVVV